MQFNFNLMSKYYAFIWGFLVLVLLACEFIYVKAQTIELPDDTGNVVNEIINIEPVEEIFELTITKEISIFRGTQKELDQKILDTENTIQMYNDKLNALQNAKKSKI